MVAPVVLSVIVTVCGTVNVPVAGVITGVAAGGSAEIVYVALATALLENPVAVAMALIVSVAVTLIGAEYCCVDPPTLVAGVEPSKV